MYKQNEELFTDNVNDQIVFLDIKQGKFYLLPKFVEFIYKCIISGASVDDIKNMLIQFSKCDKTVLNKVDVAFNELIQLNILQETDNFTKTALPILDDDLFMDFQDENFDSIITVSTDIQKLLLDDPVHDVSTDGWDPIKKC